MVRVVVKRTRETRDEGARAVTPPRPAGKTVGRTIPQKRPRAIKSPAALAPYRPKKKPRRPAVPRNVDAYTHQAFSGPVFRTPTLSPPSHTEPAVWRTKFCCPATALLHIQTSNNDPATKEWAKDAFMASLEGDLEIRMPMERTVLAAFGGELTYEEYNATFNFEDQITKLVQHAPPPPKRSTTAIDMRSNETHVAPTNLHACLAWLWRLAGVKFGQKFEARLYEDPLVIEIGHNSYQLMHNRSPLIGALEHEEDTVSCSSEEEDL